MTWKPENFKKSAENRKLFLKTLESCFKKLWKTGKHPEDNDKWWKTEKKATESRTQTPYNKILIVIT